MRFRKAKANEAAMDAELLKKMSGSGGAQATSPNLTAKQLDQDWGAIHAERRWPVVEFVLRDGASKMMTVAPHVLTVEDCDGVVLVSRVQIPLMLAYCMTVHRAQG